jgi:hypothetical protein
MAHKTGRPVQLTTWLVATALVVALAACGRGVESPDATQPSDQPSPGTVTLGQEPGGEPSPPDGAESPGSDEVPSGGDEDPEPLPDADDDDVQVVAAKEYCISYHPEHLQVVPLGSTWSLRDDVKGLKLFDTKQDAEDARKIARNWKKRCVIGSNSQGIHKYEYQISYWRVPSGLPKGVAPTFDCMSYNPAKLTIHSGVPHPDEPTKLDSVLYSGATPLLYLDTMADALRAKLVATDYTRLCFIGRGNTRPVPAMFILHHWR